MLSKSRVKYIQSLFHKKFRDEEGLFIIEGQKIVTEFLQLAPDMIKAIYGIAGWLKSNEQLTAKIDETAIYAVDENELSKISSLSTPNQVLALVSKKNAEPFTNTDGITLMLDDIQDPGNMGTIIRIADWFGIKNIVCSNGCVDIYNAKVVQSTMGSMLRVNILYEELISWCQQHSDIKIYAAALQGRSIYEHAVLESGILLIGNESKGVKEALLSLAEKITIPRIGNAESLNAAVATGIILSHLSKH